MKVVYSSASIPKVAMIPVQKAPAYYLNDFTPSKSSVAK